MTVFIGVLIIAAVIATPIVADAWARQARARRVVPNVKPPEAVNAFMGREPDTSMWGYAIWVRDGELYWCPYVRPAAPVDGDGA
jgi:hypothetical protein